MKAVVAYRYVSKDRDRHGNDRYYFRRKGHKKVRLPGKPGSTEFQQTYDAAFAAIDFEPKRAIAPTSIKIGTLRWLCQRYVQSSEFKQLDPSTRVTRRQILDHMCAEPIAPGAEQVFGDCPIKRLTQKAVRVLRDRKAQVPNAANTRVKTLRRLFKWALEDETAGMSENPARDISFLRTPSAGFHSWTVDEVRRFEQRHPVGTKARLAFALLLYTGQRRSDVVLFGKQHIQAGSLRFTQRKNRNRRPITLELPILPLLRGIIDNSPTGDLTFLVTDHGRPFTSNGFGNKMRTWCDEAGLTQCSAHGLRKAGATIAAENGATTHQLMSIFGWLTLKQAEHYTKAADQKKLAASAMSLLERKGT